MGYLIMTAKSTNKVLERTRFYEEIASSGIEYTPPTQYFRDVQEVMEDMIKQINDLRNELELKSKK